jgi:hypothetical protein
MRPIVARRLAFAILLVSPFGSFVSRASAAPPPGWIRNAKQKHRPDREDGRRLRRVREVAALPSSVLLLVGERLSFRGVYRAGVQDPETLQIQIDDGILTIKGRRAGRTTLLVYGGDEEMAGSRALSSPRAIPVTVTR